MLYLSGIHALKIENTLNTCGDWHTSALITKDASAIINIRKQEGLIMEKIDLKRNTRKISRPVGETYRC